MDDSKIPLHVCIYIYITQYIYINVFLFELETTAFIGSPPFCHRGCGICDAFGPKTGDLGPATWPFSSCNCIKSDLPPLTGHNQKGQKDRTVICQYFRNGFYFFFSLPGLALTTNSGHLWLFFCKHHFDSLRGLTMARCSP